MEYFAEDAFEELVDDLAWWWDDHKDDLPDKVNEELEFVFASLHFVQELLEDGADE